MRPKFIAIVFSIFILSIGTIPAEAATGLPFWKTPVKVEGMSASRLSAVWFKNQLHIVHGGKDGDTIWHASWDGKQWMINRVSNLSGKGAPALAVYQNKLHMVYKGKNNALWHATSEGKNWIPKGKIPGQKSHYSPSLVLYPYDIRTAQPRENLWMWHSGGSKDTKRDSWYSFFDGSAWSKDQKIIGPSENTMSLCMHKNRLYRAIVYAKGINILYYGKEQGWVPMETIPKKVETTTPVSLVSDGDNLYIFYRRSRLEAGKEEPIYASAFSGRKWEDPLPVKNFTTSDSPVVVAVPGQKGQFYLLYTRNKDIYFTSTQDLKMQFKPLKQSVR